MNTKVTFPIPTFPVRVAGYNVSTPLLPFHTHPSGITHLEELLELKFKLCLHPHDAKKPAK